MTGKYYRTSAPILKAENLIEFRSIYNVLHAVSSELMYPGLLGLLDIVENYRSIDQRLIGDTHYKLIDKLNIH